MVYVESTKGSLKKASREAVSYGAALDSEVTAIALGSGHNQDELGSLGANGATKVLIDNDATYDNGDSNQLASSLNKAAEQLGANTIIFGTSPATSAVAARLSVKMGSTLVTNISDLPDTSSGFALKRGIFTGKAFETVEVSSEKKVLVVKKNAVDLKEDGSEASVENVSLVEGGVSFEHLGQELTAGDILLPEAEIVVSAGRGLKGPENWGMVEELAQVLGAATACSKPVSDMDWRPHHEHVGQTGIKVSPQLYIAIGISGAIQHLAGVNSSKYIVVINKDPEAPFFKEADYGIVGDAFEVVPQLINALKAAG